MKSRVKIAALLFVAGTAAAPATATTAVSALCEDASARAAAQQDIPQHILRTLTLAESGKTVDGILRPWPWAINQAGDGHWFSSQEQMLAYAENLIATGQTNFDIGCFQLNYRWHGQQFASLAQMADPDSNAAYAAWFLRSKYVALGSWKAAVGAYHSQTEDKAAAYLDRFEQIYARWAGTGPQTLPEAEVAAPEPVRPANNFPLLIAGNASHGASLVPVTGGRLRLIGADQ